MNDERDELIERVARTLKPLPPSNARAAAEILATVRARSARAPKGWMFALAWMGRPAFSFASASLLAAAALAVGFVTRGAIASLDEAAPAAASRTVSVPAVEAANLSDAVRAVPVPITFDAATAKTVSIVGDFNEWDADASPLTRFGSNGPWTATVKVTPGRHLYAFMVDGKLVVDPSKPHARDLDFGGDASVLMVTAP